MFHRVTSAAVRSRRVLRAPLCDSAHGWGHGFIHGERQGTCGGAEEETQSKHVSIEEEVRNANERGKEQWEIRQTCDKGYGIYLLKDFDAGEVLFRAKCVQETKQRTSHSVQTGWDRHVFMDLPARFINHSCEANVGIKDNNLGAFDFISLVQVSRGDELTWDYGGAEFESISIDNCLCGKSSCRGHNLGFRQSHLNIRRQYAPLYAKYLHDWSDNDSSNSK